MRCSRSRCGQSDFPETVIQKVVRNTLVASALRPDEAPDIARIHRELILHAQLSLVKTWVTMAAYP